MILPTLGTKSGVCLAGWRPSVSVHNRARDDTEGSGLTPGVSGKLAPHSRDLEAKAEGQE